MWVKKFVARTLPEAMAQIKAELGPDAVILHTSQVKIGGIFGLFGTRMIEVSAAADPPETRPTASPRTEQVSAPLRNLSGPVPGRAPEERVLAEPPRTAPPIAAAAETGAASLSERLVPKGSQPAAGNGVPAPADDPGLTAVRNEMVSMKAMLGMVLDRFALPGQSDALKPETLELLSRLVEGGIEEAVAIDLLSRVRSNGGKDVGGPELKAALRQTIREDLAQVVTAEVGEGKRKIISLVGPTGVGKTTTLAKLAAHFALGRRLDIALITADTYRIAAVEQLRTYADILGVPLEIIYDPEDMAVALARHRRRDLVLVDTAGRSPRNVEHMRELQEYLQTLSPDETYLVISLTSGFREASTIVESYLPLGVQRFIFTKWDEVQTPGLLYSMVQKYKLPISYITNGQNVPDDIEIADPDKITRAIVGD